MKIDDQTFYLCEDCYHKLYLLNMELEVITIPVGGICWMCDREVVYGGNNLHWCVRPVDMKEEENGKKDKS